MTKMLVSFIS